MNALSKLTAIITAATKDAAMRDADRISLESDKTDWLEIATAARVALAALRKVKRIREADDEAGEIVRDALKRMEIK